MLKFFIFIIAKYTKNKNYVPPSKGKTVLVCPSKDKDGVLKQDWDVYIGHGLNSNQYFGEVQMVQSILHGQIICKDM